MIKWNDISIKYRLAFLCVAQSISIAFISSILDADFGVVVFWSILLLIIFSSELNKEENKKFFLIYTVIITLFWLYTHFANLTKNFNIDYKQLKSYSGEIYDSMSKHSTACLTLKNKLDEQRDTLSGRKWMVGERTFVCSATKVMKDARCFKEINQYFGVKNLYGHNISVKYASPLKNIRVIYEIIYNNNVTYDYDYFINKYSQQQKNLRFFAIYLIIDSLIFCVLYWIQKDFVNQLNNEESNYGNANNN